MYKSCHTVRDCTYMTRGTRVKNFLQQFTSADSDGNLHRCAVLILRKIPVNLGTAGAFFRGIFVSVKLTRLCYNSTV